MRTLGRTGSPLGGRSDVPMSTNKDTGLVTEMYLSANDLHDIKIEGDEDTVDGQKLPRGVRASELFPEGCCAVGINGMSLLVGLYAEHHSNSVTSGVYHMKPLSGTGRGVADAVEVQKRFNRFDSQTTTYMAKRATPATLHVAGAIKESDRRLLGRSDVDIPVNLQNFPEVRSLRDLVYPLSGESVPGDMLQYTYQHLQNFMQLAYHTTNLGGAPTPSGIQNNTATYAEIADANSESLFTPTLSIKANVRLDTARKAFELWCNTSPVPRFLPFDRAAKSGARGMDISGEDVKGEYEWSVVPGSELPKTKLSKRKDSMQFYAMFGGIPAYLEAKTAAPQDVAEIERVFDMDLASDNYDDIGEICRTRFENLKEIWGQAEQMRAQAFEQFGVEVPQPDPLMLLEEVKPSLLVTESHLPEKALWFSNLLDTGEGQVMEDAERNLVSALAQGMMMLAKGQAIEIATGEAEVAMSAQAPMMEAQAQQEAGAAEMQGQQKQADMEVKQAENQMKLDADMEREGMKAATEMMKIKAQADTRAYPKNEGKSAAKKK